MKKLWDFVLTELKKEKALDVARKTGLNSTKVWRILRTGTLPSLTDMEIIMNAYGITLERALWEITKPSKKAC